MKIRRIFRDWRMVWIILVVLAVPLIFCKDKPRPKCDFYAAIISDTHISDDQSKDQRLSYLVEKINAGEYPKLELLIHLGDVVSSVYKDFDYADSSGFGNRLQKAVQILDQLQVPYYLAMGNHDYKIHSDRDSDTYFPRDEIEWLEIIWQEHTGFKPYYSFTLGLWRVVVLNSMRGRWEHRHFDDEQMDWLEKQLCNDKPAILCFHHPLRTDHFKFWCKPRDWITKNKEQKFYQILQEHADDIKAIFVGHGHRWIKDRLFERVPVYEVDSFGESKGMPFYLIGFVNRDTTVVVERMK